MTQPTPPAHLLQRIANNPDPTDFLNSFGYLRHAVKFYLNETGFDFAKFNDILDFGCGVGRFMLAFQHELGPDQRIRGCDVYEECAHWCQQNIQFAKTAHSSIEPPLPYEDHQFDFVYALSVFTHMRLDLQFRWAWEIYRVMKPGGVLFATVHGPQFIPSLYEEQLTHPMRRQLYSFGDDGLFAYLSFLDDIKDEGQVDVVAAHTPSFFREQFSSFEMLKRFPQSDLAAEQDLYVLSKPEHGRPISLPVFEGSMESGQWAWQQKLGEGNGSPVVLRFDLNGHRTFRVYPSVVPAGIYGADCHIDIKSGEQTLVSERVPFNNNRVYGKTHYAAIEMAVPEHTGEVAVQLSMGVRPGGTPAGEGEAEVAWSFPHFS